MRLFFFIVFLLPAVSNAGCDRDKVKLEFIERCQGELIGNALKEDHKIDRAANKAMCKCAAVNFPVERTASDSCHFDSGVPLIIVESDKVQLKCL